MATLPNLSVAIILLAFLCVKSERPVVLSCGADENVQRGPLGAPGKRGAKGEDGVKGEVGMKGEKGQSDDTREEISSLAQRITSFEHDFHYEIEQAVGSRRNCEDVASQGYTRSGIYSITLGSKVVRVYCEMLTNDGNWTVIQRRKDGSENFRRKWKEYEIGFGRLQDEFWLGLENLHALTGSGSYQLRVDLEDFENNTAYAIYGSFVIGDANSNYRATAGDYSGNAGDSLLERNNFPFSTNDQDHDASSSNCAEAYGAWWYHSCHYANLNGDYIPGGQISARGICWYHWKNNYYSMKFAEMKIRPNL